MAIPRVFLNSTCYDLAEVRNSFRSFLLAPCLLICLACATPFPFENLEEDMTAETVREELGAPSATETAAGTGESCWTYWHEEQEWVLTYFPLTPFTIPLYAFVPGITWYQAYAPRSAVLLFFREEKLVEWRVIEAGVTSIDSIISDPLSPVPGTPIGSVPALVPFPVPPLCSAISSSPGGFLDRYQLGVKLLERNDQWCHVEDGFGSDTWISCGFRHH
jgi:hypothetical protein